jgi:pyruvate-formate lyase-activating enzyme
LDGITLSGGDPLEQYENFIPLVKYVNQQNKNV